MSAFLLATIPIKFLPKGKNVLCSIIDPSIKEGDCSDAWECFAHHCENVSSQIKVIYFDQYYSPVAHYE